MIRIMEPRTQVYTYQEKKTFLQIIKKYSEVVEDKHTHGSALKAKYMAWHKITSEFNLSPQTKLNRTPKQLRRLWMDLKQRQRKVLARTLHPLSASGPVDGMSESVVLQALIGGDDNSMVSDFVLERTTNADSVQSETSLCLSEESQNISNQREPEFGSAKIEPTSPIITNVTTLAMTGNIGSTPRPTQTPILTLNNKAHVAEPDKPKKHRKSSIQRDLELHNLEVQLLKEKLRSQRLENKRREAHAAEIHNLECQNLKEKLRETTAKADIAELHLRRQLFSDD